MNLVIQVIRWTLTIVFFILMLGGFSEGGFKGVIIGLLFLTAFAYTCPPIHAEIKKQKKRKEKTNPVEATKGFLMLALILFVAWVYFSSDNTTSDEQVKTTQTQQQVRNEVAAQPSVKLTPERIKIIVWLNTPEGTGHTECSNGLPMWMFKNYLDAPIKLKALKTLTNMFDRKPFIVLRDNPFKAKYNGRNIINYKTDLTLKYSCIFDLENDSTSYALEIPRQL
jgi:hypothetical protein